MGSQLSEMNVNIFVESEKIDAVEKTGSEIRNKSCKGRTLNTPLKLLYKKNVKNEVHNYTY